MLTNGVTWRWYRHGHDGKPVPAPFLVHDVRSPEAPELPWLKSVSARYFDSWNARAQAEDTSIASEILDWIEETLRLSDLQFGDYSPEAIGTNHDITLVPWTEETRLTDFEGYGA